MKFYFSALAMVIGLPLCTHVHATCSDSDIPSLMPGERVDINLHNFEGQGANPGGVDGALDTCQWEIRNRGHESTNDYNVLFGSTYERITPEPGFDRLYGGTTVSGVHSSGALYSLIDFRHLQPAVYIQPASDFFTTPSSSSQSGANTAPIGGSLTSRVMNVGQEAIDTLRVNFRQYQNNDRTRNSLITVSYATENHHLESSYTDLAPSLERDEGRDDLGVRSSCLSFQVPQGLALMPSSTFYLRFTFHENPDEAGRRDESGIGSVSYTTIANDTACTGVTEEQADEFLGKIQNSDVLRQSNPVLLLKTLCNLQRRGAELVCRP